MSNLLSSLASAGEALEVYQQALSAIQNNLTNSATPGYARQSLNLEARPFDLAGGMAGGVASRGLDSARDEYAEEEVRRQAQSLGRYEAQAQGAASIENLFDISGNTGIPARLDSLFQSFSAWSVDPSSEDARQNVIANAGTLASDIRSLAGALAQIAGGVHDQIGSAVEQINQLAAAVRQYNVEQGGQNSPDPGLDAHLHASLEQLSELVDITTLTRPDGTVSVLLSNGSPLVVGDTQYAISADLGLEAGAPNSQAPPSSRILDWQGNDITDSIQGGKLSGFLDVHNRVLASLTGDGSQAGSLNQFAQAFAGAVNGILASGTTAPGAGAANGMALFVYDNSDPTLAAGSFAVNPNITTGGLAPVDAAGNANGNALLLASLANSTSAGGINGRSFGAFFGQMVSAAGRESATASDNQQVQRQVIAQTRALRDQSSGVSLDEQAMLLLQFQNSYQATARLLSVLDSLVDTTINLIPG